MPKGLKFGKSLRKFTRWLGPGGHRDTPNIGETNYQVLKRIWPDGTWKRAVEVESINARIDYDIVETVWDSKSGKKVERVHRSMEQLQREEYQAYDHAARCMLSDLHFMEERYSDRMPGLPPPADGQGMAGTIIQVPIPATWLPSATSLTRFAARRPDIADVIAYVTDELRIMGKLRA